MKDVQLFDDVDKVIVSELQEDGRVSLVSIGKKIGISHVAVRKRLDNLLKENLLKVSADINAESLGGRVAVITVEVENYSRLKELIGLFQHCPRVIFLFTLSASNLMTVFFGENLSTLESTIGVCSLRVHKGVRRSDVQIGEAPAYPQFLPLRVQSKKDAETAPCGISCASCERLESKKCFGCPATKFYNGPL
jgi:DNA-binding Lrp family transcriptional regulator